MNTLPVTESLPLPADWRDLRRADQAARDEPGRLYRPVRPARGAGCRSTRSSALPPCLCIALGAGAAGALNQWYESRPRRQDEADRQAPASRRPDEAPDRAPLRGRPGLLLGRADGPCDQSCRGAVAAVRRSCSTCSIYTVWLKRRTAQNIVIGGAAGAFPPLIGWAAATGDTTLLPWLLVRDHLPVDAAAFLGAQPVRADRLCQGRRADAAGRFGQPQPRAVMS